MRSLIPQTGCTFCHASAMAMHAVGEPVIKEDMGFAVVMQLTQCTLCNKTQQEIYSIGDYQYTITEGSQLMDDKA